MNLFQHFSGLIRQDVGNLADEAGLAPLDVSRVTAEPPRDPAHGDIATNAAMVLAKSFRLPPRALAETLVLRLRQHEDIASAEIETLAPDVRLHEPRSALDGGPDGLDIIRRLIAEAPRYLLPQGKLLIEISGEQAEAVTQLLTANGSYDDIAILKDLAKQPRVVRAVRKG